jgi:hypothetical protein
MKHAGIASVSLISLTIVALASTLALGQTSTSKGTPQPPFNIEDAHRWFAVECNNQVWSLLEKDNRTQEDNEIMVHAAHASHYHWSVVGEPLNVQRGFWLISRVYVVLKQGEIALYYATKCMDITNQQKLQDFDLAYAYEAMARAHATLGNYGDAGQYIQLAQEAGEKIAGTEDRSLFFSDFNAGPWYGLK